MKFESYNIAQEINQNLAKEGFKRPTDIQFKSIPPILRGEDVLAIAQTGTGKTAAFAIPVLSKLYYKKNRKGLSCLVMVPTHELATQIAQVFETLGKGTTVKVACVHGGVDQQPQIEKLKKADVLVATPGRMFDLMHQNHINLSQIDTLILDEADQMLALGFYKDIKDVLKHIPRKHQTLFFSATIDENIKKLAYSLVHNPIRIQISPKDPVSKNVDHSVMEVIMDDKRFFLERIHNENDGKKILVFVRTKVRAERVAKAMERVNIKSEVLHGDKNQTERVHALEQFKTGASKMLITTDVSARGIDIPGVELVINYDIPEQPESYVHRVGRTGRGTQKGFAISFCSPEEKELFNNIEKYIGKNVKVINVDNKEYAATIDFSEDNQKDINSLLSEIEFLENKKRKAYKGKKKK
ncbi:DEAD/DEAH box helicase [Cytophagaceae bacterium ABcell3]|nr:DEAD/DEAH box helicase [Cytophagaceae bacterium ABcell3]